MIELNPVYKPLFTTDKRYILVTGGRGSSKSFSVNTGLVLMSYEPGHMVLHTRYTMTSAELSIIPEFTEKINLMGVQHHFKQAKTSVVNTKTNSSFIFRGIKTSTGDQTAALKSITGLTDWVLDEAEELKDEKKFDDIALSVRGSAAKNRIILILNPTTRDHWIWQRWFENSMKYVEIDGFKIPVSTHPDICHIHTTYLDNLKHLPPDYVQELMSVKDRDPEKYRHKILGGWLEKAEGVVFENWDLGKFDESLPYLYGQDFGFFPDPQTMVRVAVDRRKKIIYAQERFYLNRMGVKDVIMMTKRRINRPKDLIVCDTSEPRTRAEMKAAGLNVAAAVKEQIKEDVREMSEYKIIVDPDSNNLIRELNNYAWNDKKASIPIDDHNHLIDPLRYGFRRLVGSRRGKVRLVN